MVLVGAVQLVSGVVLWRRAPDLLAERSQIQTGAKRWDVWMALVMAFGVTLIALAGGLGYRFLGAAGFPLGLRWLAGVVFLISLGLSIWAMLANHFFSGLVRIKTDRGHQVVSSGPYAFIRHPGYASAVLTYLAAPLLLDSGWAFAGAALVLAVTALRTAREDRALQAELPGYAAYVQRVRFRWLPGIW